MKHETRVHVLSESNNAEQCAIISLILSLILDLHTSMSEHESIRSKQE